MKKFIRLAPSFHFLDVVHVRLCRLCSNHQHQPQQQHHHHQQLREGRGGGGGEGRGSQPSFGPMSAGV
jgi:hypothetical protein